ncbi:hypothetical protein L6164_028348 [Bauhinia variegata]|uniref:Uncharacterized protein n=1 Tax=Bauhinia variegata TaxID=167791 RepID=A0ACB9LW65_BAUVA|nr:hypothetical protein L6164_028348 [Bauhinia variegata]
MADSKRWTVTYTKHIKRKRKVYQDGFLDLHTSTNKVLLYDDCEKLLECRLLKNDEIVKSGETLLFNSYLIDIGDPEGENKPTSDLNKNIFKRSNLFSESKTRIHSDDTKTSVKEKKAHQALSPSQKMIKEFKTRELLKYGSPKMSPEITKDSPAEWQVLYTAQLTQKTKKYHDGFLRLVICGSRGQQVMLFDSSRKLLDSRFQKKDEVIRSGESIAFDAYLIDIGEYQGNFKLDSSVQGNTCTDYGRRGMIYRQQNSLQSLDAHITVGKSEWQVLYTAQLTQKSKRYHDGFLQLEFCGSQGRKIVLCDSIKTPIECKFLKKDEVIRTGESVLFDGHLVEVGEPERSHQSLRNPNEQTNSEYDVERRQIRHGRIGCLRANLSVAEDKHQSKASLRKDADSNPLFSGLYEIKSNRIVPPLRPLRDAHQILSILQNPMAPESNATGGQPIRASAPSHKQCENRKLNESMKFPNFMSSKAENGCGGVQLTRNIKVPHQPYSNMEAQTNMGEADSAFSVSSSGAHSYCPMEAITGEGKKADMLSCTRETDECPSFNLGF